MRRDLAAFALLVLATGCAQQAIDDGAASPIGSATSAAASLTNGEALYANNCARCHGADLRGTELGPPHLDTVYEPSHHADVSFQMAIERGARQHHWSFGDMPPIEGLSEADVADIIAYVRAEQRAVGIG